MQHTSDKRGNDAKAGTSLIYGLNICSIGANHTLRFEQATPENLSGLTHNMGLFYILGTALGGGQGAGGEYQCTGSFKARLLSSIVPTIFRTSDSFSEPSLLNWPVKREQKFHGMF